MGMVMKETNSMHKPNSLAIWLLRLGPQLETYHLAHRDLGLGRTFSQHKAGLKVYATPHL